MVIYYPTLAIIAAAGFSSFRQLYRHISEQGCATDQYYTITYVDAQGMIRTIVVPVWKILTNSLLELGGLRRRRLK